MRILVNSSDRDTTQYTNSYLFRHDVKGGIQNAKMLTLRTYNIWDSSYVVNSNNNTMSFSDGLTNVITLTQGNYTGTTLATELQTQLNNGVSLATFTVTYTSSTNKFTIAASTSITYHWSSYPLCGNLFGFTSNVSGTSNTSSKCAVICTTPFYYLVFGNLPSVSKDKRYHFLIHNNVIQGSLNTPSEILKDSINLYGVSFQYLDVELRDSNYNLVDLNNTNYTFELELCM